LKKRILIILAIIFTGVCALLFNSFYKDAKNTAIKMLNEEQMIHAKQAARGIENFFAMWTRNLNSLSKMNEISDNDAVGQRYMKLFYEANQELIGSITRLDERGIIIYNFPSNSSVGNDISDQKHVRELLRDHKPVISDVFKAVEGFDSIALHVPILRGSEFKGSIGMLINFESLAKLYLDVIKIGKTGYAWVVSRDGTILYSPIPGFTGKSVFENIKGIPSLMAMVNDMLNGHEGAATYTFDRIGDRNVGQTRKYAVYMPIHIGNTFWSIVVASAEQDVLSGLISFRNKMLIAIGALFVCGMVFSTLGAKAWLIVKEEEKRKKAEEEAARLRNELARYLRVNMLGEISGALAHELNQPLAAILSSAQAGLRFLHSGKANSELLGSILQNIVEDDKRAAEVITSLRSMVRKEKGEKRPVYLNDILSDVIKIYNSEAAALNLKVETGFFESLPACIGDKVQLRQVVLNLIMNAADAMSQVLPENKKMILQTKRTDHGVQASVRDFGLGIDDSIINHIFEPFFTTKNTGLGIGLALCKTIILDHGGRIWAENNPDGGATFVFELPVIKND
jgi:signal transduction histidine kinase